MSAKARGFSAADIQLWQMVLILAVFALTVIGFVMVYSTTSVELVSAGKNPSKDLLSQLAFAVVAVAVAILLWRVVPYGTVCGRWVWGVWGSGIALLVLTAVMGTELYGAKRWLDLGFFGFQPSEFVKIALLVMAIRIACEARTGEVEGRALIVRSLLFVGAPLGFLYLTQSDLGTTLICAAGIVAVMWFAGASKRFMLVLVVLGLVVVFVAVFGVGYRADRLVYLDPWNDGEGGYGSGYNIIRSYYAIAEGGLFGVGLGNSHEKFRYLFGSESDFIFSVICEELGMVGAFLVIALFGVILVAGLRIALASPDETGSLVAGGFTIMLVFQAALNIGCAIGVLPTTGKPLPFISSGGTSLVASYIMVGLILSVAHAGSAPSIYEKRRADLRIVRAQRPSSKGGSSRSGRRARGFSEGRGREARSPQRSPRSDFAVVSGLRRLDGSQASRR